MYGRYPRNAPRPHAASEHSRGFTLLELTIALAVVAVLAAIGVPSYRSYVERSKMKAAMNDIRGIEDDIAAYELEWEHYPASLDQVGGPYIDPWGNPYQYQRIAGEPLTGPDKITPRKDKALHPLNSDYDLYSKGPDGDSKTALTAQASHDDIIRAADGGFVGVASDY